MEKIRLPAREVTVLIGSTSGNVEGSLVVGTQGKDVVKNQS